MGSVLWLGWKPKSNSPILFCSAELGCPGACCPSGLTLHAAQLAPPAAGLGNGRTSKSKRLGFAVSNLVHCTWSSQLLVPFLSSFLKRSWCLWVEIPPSKVLLGSLTAQVQPGPSSGVVVLGPSHHAALSKQVLSGVETWCIKASKLEMFGFAASARLGPANPSVAALLGVGLSSLLMQPPFMLH